MKRTWAAILGLSAGAVLACASGASADPGTAQDRAALFDYLLNATMRRTAFAERAPADIGQGAPLPMAEHVRSEMLAYRDEMIAADTDEKLYYVLTRISNARSDSHVEGVTLVEGGLAPFPPNGALLNAPIKFKPDFSGNMPFLFVSDFAANFSVYGANAPRIGDRLVAVNRVPIDRYIARIRPYYSRSTTAALWWAMAGDIVSRSNRLPQSFYGERIALQLQARNGSLYTVRLPYLAYDAISWSGHDDHYVGGELSDRLRADPDFPRRDPQYAINAQRYPGFEHFSSSPTFDIYISRTRRIVLLKQHRFVPRYVASDLERLLAFAQANALLDAAVIFDLTRGRGGDFEEYTLQRLQPQPFRLIFGNLRISDITQPLARQLREEAIASIARGPGITAAGEGPNDGSFLLEWLDNDLARAIQEQRAYSNSVPFKSQWAPPGSEGILQPARLHFSGPIVLFTSPHTCSGADQFATMFIDNHLGLSVGMPEGGCSNTWEWEEVLTLPSSGRPVVRYAWSVGHSISPNGAVMEGNPARPEISIPLTRDNHQQYYELLMAQATAYIARSRNRIAKSR